MGLLHLDHKRAGERHSLKDLPEIQRIHGGSEGGWGYVKYVRNMLDISEITYFQYKKKLFGYHNI